MSEIEKDGAFSDIFKDEDLSQATEGYEKNLSSITEALTKLRTEGKLTADEQKELMKALGTSDLSVDNLQKLGRQELEKYTEQLRDFAKTANFSDEAMDDLNNYIKQLELSYGDLGAV
jgi:hypothetical protein